MNVISKIKSNHFLYSTALLIAVLPVKKMVVPALILVIISWILNDSFTEKIKQFKKNQMVWMFILPFLAYLWGMLYSQNQSFGWKDIEIKLSFFIFPLIYGTTMFPLYNYKRLLSLIFVYSSSIIGLLSIAYGAIVYGKIPIYGMMDLFLHPSYLAMYLNVAIIFILSIYKRKDIDILHRNFLLISFIVISISVWLSLSKSGIVLWVIIMFAKILHDLFIQKHYKRSIILLFTISSALVVAVLYIPKFKERFNTLVTVPLSEEKINKITAESSQVRVLIWEQAVELIKENPYLGTGTGDIKDELYVKYENAGMQGALEKKLNVHNQYLQVFATLGIIGFFVFILAFAYPAIIAIQMKHWVYIAFLCIFGINLLTESMLEKQDGVVFYAFLNALVYFHFSNQLNRKSSERS